MKSSADTNITQLTFRPPTKERLEVELLTIDELKKRLPKSHHRRWLRADFFRLYGVCTGVTRPVVDFTQRLLEPGDWMLVHPGQVLQYDFGQPWSGELVVFPRQTLLEERLVQAHVNPAGARMALAHGRVWRLPAQQHGLMRHSVAGLRQDIAAIAPSAAKNEMLRLQLTALMLRLMGLQEAPADSLATSPKDHQYSRFLLLLEEAFTHQHHVAYYADRLGLHPKTLGRLVRSHAGTDCSAKSVIAERIVLEAKRLLAHTSQPVQSIAYSLGFEDPSNFVKFFRKGVGTSPLAFRNGLHHPEMRAEPT